MNYLIIQNDKVPETTKPPYNVIQMFSDEDVFALATFLQDSIDNHGDLDNDSGCKAAHTLLELLGQWENKTQ